MFSFKNKKINVFINKIQYLIIIFFLINTSSTKFISNIIDSEQLLTYDNSSITEECLNGPKKETRMIKYPTFEEYSNNNKYKDSGLAFYTSLYVDTDYHDFGDFMNGRNLIIILFILAIIFLISWIPLIICWKKQVCIFDKCCFYKKYCPIFWHIFTYVLFAAILSFLIVCIIFAE